MTTAENIKLNLDEKAHSYAKVYASLLSDEFQRKRSYASLVALYSLIDVLGETSYPVQKAMTLFRNPQINEQYEISDLYVNGWHIDVRVVTGGDAVLLPKVHFDSDIVPDFYVVVKVDSSLQNAEVLGAIDAKNIEKETFDSKYYFVPFTSFIDYNSFIEKLAVEKQVVFSEEDHSLFRNSYLSMLDNNLDLRTKNKVLKHLFECSVCRTEFCCFTGFEMVCCHSSTYPEIMDDHTLGYVGAQNADDKKYEGKEETIYIGTDAEEIQEEPVTQELVAEAIEETVVEESSQSEQIADETVEKTGETVSDILDGLFHVDEITVAENVVEEKPIEIEETSDLIIEEEEPVLGMEDDNPAPASVVDAEISSIDDILDEVCSDIEPLQTNESNEKLYEADTDLQQLDDSLFLDVPRKYPDIVEENGEVRLVPEAAPTVAEAVTETENETINVELESDELSDDILELDEEEKTDEIVDIEQKENSEIVTIDDELEEVYPTEEEFVINGGESEIENIEDEIIDEATMLSQEEAVQKVIVDYDEYGEPIYSYVTGVEQDNVTKEDSLIIDDEPFEEYKDDENSEIEEIEEIGEQDENEEEYESVYSDSELNNNQEELNEDENVSSELDEDEKDLEEASIDQEKLSEIELEEDDEPIDVSEDDAEDEEQPSIIDDILYNEDEMGENSDDVEEMEDEEYEMNSHDENIDDEYESEEYEEDEDYLNLPEENTKKSNPLAVITVLLLLLGLATGGVLFFLNKDKFVEEKNTVESTNENAIEIAENPAVNDMFEQPVENSEIQIPTDNNEQNQSVASAELPVENPQPQEQLPALPETPSNVSVPELTESDLIIPVQRKSNGDVNKTIVNAFATNTSPVSLRALNWFCASDLFSDKAFKNYLQTLDNSLKQNLRSNFMNLVESSPKDTVVAKFAVDNRGNLKKVMISESSGSADIDNVVLQSINETFEREKSQILNDNELKQDMYYLKVAIKL